MALNIPDSRPKLDPSAPSRSVTEVGAGDFVKLGSQWHEVESNTAQGAVHTPSSWTLRTKDGRSVGMWDVNRYAKAEDLK